MTRFEDEVLRVLRGLEPGEVITYGEVAEEAGFPGAARAVGNILSKSSGLPWWRVVGAGGYLKTGEVDRQSELLRAEGVRVTGRRVTPDSVDVSLTTSEDAPVDPSPQGKKRKTGPAMTETPRSGISVTGTGEITGTPDTVTINLGVSVRRNTVQQATADAANAATNLIDSLTAHGIVQDSITTTRYSINPEYDHRHDAQILLGYRVDNTVRARIKDIAESGNVIDQATTASGDAVRVDGISFSIEDDAGLISAAREAAWNDARTKAEQLAGLAGRKLGPVTSIAETVGRPPAPMNMARLQLADSSTPIQAGSASVWVSLQVEFSFQD